MKQDLNTTKQKIDALDLEPIKFKLVEEKGWSRDFADQMEKVYKRLSFPLGEIPGVRHDAFRAS